MSDNQKKNEEFLRIALTPAQIEQVKQTTGKDIDAIELTIKELEDRIAPLRMYV
jgi:hypothetical protein